MVYNPGTAEILHTTQDIESHLHHEGTGTKVFGSDGGTGGLLDSSVDYQATCGNDAFGAELILLKAADTPVDVGMLFFDPHELSISNTDQAGRWSFKFYHGTGAFGAAAVLTTKTVNIERVGALVVLPPFSIGSKRIAVGDTVWVTVKCAGQTAKIIDFQIEIHEYLI